MNKLLSHYYTTRPNYCHCIEVETANELHETVESAFEAYTGEGWDQKTIIEFLTSLTVYANTDDESEENKINDVDIYADILANLI